MSNLTLTIDDPKIQQILDRFRGLRLPFENYTIHSAVHDLLLTEVVITAASQARTKIVVDRDVAQSTRAPKFMREYALEKAVEWGLLELTEWRGNVAWISSRKTADSATDRENERDTQIP